MPTMSECAGPPLALAGMPWAKRLAPLLPRVTALRHRLHRSPEIAHEESGTAAALGRWLEEHAGLTPLASRVGGTGLLYRVEGAAAGSAAAGAERRGVLLRSELDGLPLIEASGVPHTSELPGRHHACGHDGHSCMLAATLALLHQHRAEWAGTVYGLFQPAEETGSGALAVLADDDAMATLSQAGGVERAYSIHNIPQRPLGSVMVRPQGTMCRASMGLRVQLRGVQSHAAMPWEGNNPMLPLAALASLAAELPLRHPAAAGELDPICTLVHLNCGTRDYGVNPGVGEIGVTLRACSTATVDAMAAELEDFARDTAESHLLTCETVRIDRFGATVNDAASSDIVLAAAAHVAGVPSIEVMEQPFSWSEDFGAIADRWGGCLIGLGGGAENGRLFFVLRFPSCLFA